MDPDVLLDNLRNAVHTFFTRIEDESFTTDEIVSIAEDAIVMFDNLDNWLTNGGFPPLPWSEWGHTPALLT